MKACLDNIQRRNVSEAIFPWYLIKTIAVINHKNTKSFDEQTETFLPADLL